jgi:hypothetical protein
MKCCLLQRSRLGRLLVGLWVMTSCMISGTTQQTSLQDTLISQDVGKQHCDCIYQQPIQPPVEEGLRETPVYDEIRGVWTSDEKG